jgi:hypothetical protein
MKNPALNSKRASIAAAAIVAVLLFAPPITNAASSRASHPASRNYLHSRAMEIAQDEAPDDETTIPTDQVEKYIAVYSAMQKDHSISVDQASAKQGLTVAQFRDLEDKIERNPVIHQRVLDALKTKTAGDKSSVSAKSGSGKSKSPESDPDPMRGKAK